MPEPHTLTVVLTRSAEDCEDWAARLTEAGARAVMLPCIATEHSDDPALRAALERETAVADWLVFTSRRGVEAFAALHARPLPDGLRIAAVGPATGEAARERLGRADLIGRQGTAAGLGEELGAAIAADERTRVVLALAANAGDMLEKTLAARGARCIRFDVYRTIPAPLEKPKQPLSTLEADAVLFASPTAVMGFLNRVEIDAPARFFSIGPSTSAALREAELTIAGEAREPSLEGLLEIMQCPMPT